jgi:hypothetical protein
MHEGPNEASPAQTKQSPSSTLIFGGCAGPAPLHTDKRRRDRGLRICIPVPGPE